MEGGMMSGLLQRMAKVTRKPAHPFICVQTVSFAACSLRIAGVSSARNISRVSLAFAVPVPSSTQGSLLDSARNFKNGAVDQGQPITTRSDFRALSGILRSSIGSISNKEASKMAMPPSEESQGSERGPAHESAIHVASQPTSSVSWHTIASPDSLSWNPLNQTQQREPTRELVKPYVSADMVKKASA